LLLTGGVRTLQTAIAEGDTRTISLHHIHTDEDITITYKRDGHYDEAALQKLNWFLRDWRKEQKTRMDPHLIDLIWEVQRETGSKESVWVVCGYRSPQTNAMLRRRSKGVARFSQHMLGHAMDFYIPGVPLEQLRVIGLRLQRGGVGFYPTSGSPFVHMDTADVRHWPRMTREQLVRVFPDGRTVHIPTDGRPLPGYALALADIRRRGGNPSFTSIEAARNAGVNVNVASLEHHKANPFLKLLGLGKNEEDEEGDTSSTSASTATAESAESTPAPAREPLRKRVKAAVVAAIERAEDKLAAEKAKVVQIAATEKVKLAKVASKVHLIRRAEAATPPAAAPAEEAQADDAATAADDAAITADDAVIDEAPIQVAAVTATPAPSDTATAAAPATANDIIRARGYWQGLPDGMTAAQPVATQPLAPAPQRRRVEVASASAEATGTITTSLLARDDHVPPELALAYAEQPARDLPSVNPVTATINAAAGAHAASSRLPAMPGDSDMTIAVKRVTGRPASTILTINRAAAAREDGRRPSDPWLRGIVLAPNVRYFLSTVALGARDFRALAPLMVKPASSVMMTFCADPLLGLTHDRFSGSAIVFVSTVTYATRTAELR
jgi:uncharacterized protein YcbK (DUF882 family)